MSGLLNDLVRQFEGRRVLVIGDVMLDAYIDGGSERLCREAPVPIVAVDRESQAPGGAGNTAANLRALGAQVILVSVTGNDECGEALRRCLRQQGVGTDFVYPDPSRQTLVKTRVSAFGQLLVRFDRGFPVPVSQDLADSIDGSVGDLLGWAEAIVISDYGYGLLSERLIASLARRREDRSLLLMLDSKDLPRFRQLQPDVVKPNYSEAVRLLHANPVDSISDRARQMSAHSDDLIELTGATVVAVTLDTEGALICQRGAEPYRTYAKAVSQSKASGAGDTFLAAMTLGILAGGSAAEAAELASAAAGIVVREEGTCACAAADLRRELAGPTKFVGDHSRLANALDQARRRSQRIVFTNGCFDLLHSGHIAFLNRAKALGDVLVVGLNSDGSVRRLKGVGRPILGLDERIKLLDAISCVDFIATFDEDRPDELIRMVRPTIFVKGGGYTRDMVPEGDIVEALGGRVELLSYLEQRSTHDIIRRIRRHAAA